MWSFLSARYYYCFLQSQAVSKQAANSNEVEPSQSTIFSMKKKVGLQ